MREAPLSCYLCPHIPSIPETQTTAHLCLAQLTDGFPNSESAKAIKWSAGA